LTDARCAQPTDPAALAECGGAGGAEGICLPRCTPGSCGPLQACVGGACVLAELPDVPICDPVADPDAAARTLEDELLEAFQGLRTAGGACDPPAPAAAALRFDPRLLCAARVWARDLATGAEPAERDSQGRTTQDRLVAAGFTPTLWADGFAMDAQDASEAVQLMIADAATCDRFTDPDFDAVGVGVVDGVLVITVAAD
jgi:uncharacterized protein YkwD